ncbi:glycosyltransferase family 2 protein [Conexibacter sp. SYSU D00693]|uniref:glycosyltransferase family 2 protein n=1 Tax=Conexibacter sp. SYSU D00693 TaxID=2812560 RepID=UPI00196B928E|nr:glycosyltransferase [Conexibacter sp. SYSU D00693]
MKPQAVVVVPARDEEDRIGACIAALAVQAGVHPGDVEVVVVLDRCRDRTAEAVEAARQAHPWLPVTVVDGPGRGPGLARRAGMLVARSRDPRLLCSTDADSVVAHDWIAAQLAAVRGGAGAVAGMVELPESDAAAVPTALRAARSADARRRLLAVREAAPDAEHHQFTGASFALTGAAYDAVGGLAAVPEGEDEALERALHAAGIRVAYSRAARVRTVAHDGARLSRGPLRLLDPADEAQPAADDTAAPTIPAAPPLVLRAARGSRGRALREALADARTGGADVVVVLPDDCPDPAAAAEVLAAPLQADPRLVLVKAVPPMPHPLDEPVARPLLRVHAPDLAAVASPLAPAWAIRRDVLAELALPNDDAVDLTTLVDVCRLHGLTAIAQVPLALPAPPVPDLGPASYSLLSAMATRTGPGPSAEARDQRFTRGATASAW